MSKKSVSISIYFLFISIYWVHCANWKDFLDIYITIFSSSNIVFIVSSQVRTKNCPQGGTRNPFIPSTSEEEKTLRVYAYWFQMLSNWAWDAYPQPPPSLYAPVSKVFFYHCPWGKGTWRKRFIKEIMPASSTLDKQSKSFIENLAVLPAHIVENLCLNVFWMIIAKNA